MFATRTGTVLGVLVVLCCAFEASAKTPAERAAAILEQTGFTGGVIIHVGCGNGKLTAALHLTAELKRHTNCIVQGLDRDPKAIHTAQQAFLLHGIADQVTARKLIGKRLPFIDNLANLIIVEHLDWISLDEVKRVLCPKGVAYIKQDDSWMKIVKRRPAAIDDWTHYLHDASNNAVAHDKVIAPPGRLQWNDGPTYSRHHDRMSSVSAVVTSGGRIFEITDLGSPLSILLPPKWTLTARDAFNGTLLWERPIQKWFDYLWPLKSGPAILPRRLVAAGNRVYTTLAIDGPVSQLNAVDGTTLQTYGDTKGTEEILWQDGRLYLVVNPSPETSGLSQMRGGYKASMWDKKPRRIMALDAESGKTIWNIESVILPGTLATNGKHVVFHDGNSIVCLDASDGRRQWRSESVPRAEDIRSFYLPTLVLYQDVVLFSGGETAGMQTGTWYTSGRDTMTALSLRDGKKLWSAYHPPSGYRSPEDLLVANGLVWTGNTTSGRADGEFTGRDPHTGEVKVRFKPDVSTYWFHHRCYRGKATDKYLLMARAGTEFIDIETHHWDTNYWVRGACLYGIMPANGLLYAPRQPCACYLESKLMGFNAVAPAGKGPRVPKADEDSPRLEKGPAYGPPQRDAVSILDQWPTLRHDSARTGQATTKLSATLHKTWKTKLGGKLTSPVVSGKLVFVAAVERHTVYALRMDTGEPVWHYVTGGRVDSPPTVYGNRVLFGSADGYVYCLRITDGVLAWRFRAAPMDQQLLSYQQLESVWPVHGTVLIEKNVLYFVAGRSMFLDSGMRLWRLDPATGKILSKTVLNSRDTVSGKSLEQFVSWLNMPVALPDVLSSDGKYVYMRSQPFYLNGVRLPLKPIPHGADADQGAPQPVQDPEFAHLFSPTGLLDGSWFHRTYWMYGSWFVSGWSGYFLSGRVAPAGRILVLDDDNRVYGFGRKPQYFRWTVPMEYHLFAADKFPPPLTSSRRKGAVESWIEVPKKPSLNPKNSPLTIAARILAEKPRGAIVSHGGGAMGYVLCIESKRPCFAVRVGQKVVTIKGDIIPMKKWVHLAGVLDADAHLRLFVNGKQVAEGAAPGLLPGNPAEGIIIGSDRKTSIGDYASPFPFGGLIRSVRIYHRALSASEIRHDADTTGKAPVDTKQLVLAYSFGKGKATDRSPNHNDGVGHGVMAVEKDGLAALRFTGVASKATNFKVAFQWTQDVPLLVRSMILTGDTLYIAGPPDVMDEQASYRRATTPAVRKQLQKQLAAIQGNAGGVLWAVSTRDGTPKQKYKLDAPPVFSGMAAASGRLFITTIDGALQCWK